MNNSDRHCGGLRQRHDDLRQAIALFRYGVIADLVHLPLGTKGMVDKMRDKAGQPYTIPGTNRTRVAAETIRGNGSSSTATVLFGAWVARRSAR